MKYYRFMNIKELIKFKKGETLSRESQFSWHKGNFFYFFDESVSFEKIEEAAMSFLPCFMDEEAQNIYFVEFESEIEFNKIYEPDYNLVERITSSYSNNIMQIKNIINYATGLSVNINNDIFKEKKYYNISLKDSFNDKNKIIKDKKSFKKEIKNLRIARQMKHAIR